MQDKIESLIHIKSWRNDPEYKRVQQLGRDRILKWYEINIAEVEREYSWESDIHPNVA